MRTSFLVMVLPLAGLAVGACASASANPTVDRPALVVPPPPPRVIEPAPEPLPEPVSDIPPAPSPTPPSRTGRARDTTPKTSETKVDPKAEAPKPVEPIIEPVAPPPQQPPPQLRTPDTADSSGAAKVIRATIDRARLLLNSVDYGPLNKERKKAYNDAKLFLQQAEDGLKQGNVVFAQGVATKAETLARELASK
jgi:outer membrane biosynthesis protein TonB